MSDTTAPQTSAAPVDVPSAVRVMLDQMGANIATWLDSCLHCGQCAQACHFHEVSRDPRHSPAYKLKPLVKAYKRHKSPFAKLRTTLGFPAQDVTADDLREWQELIYDTCTMCGRCTVVCPMGIDTASLVGLTRTAMVAAGLGPPDLLATADRSAEVGSPLGMTPDTLEDRIEWLADDYEVDIPLDKDKARVLLTVSSIEAMKYPQSIVAMARILNHAGEDWTFSTKGYEATNFGMLSGKSDVAAKMLGRIVNAAESVGAELVIIPECGHAYGALRWTGAKILGRALPFAVQHITEYLADAKAAGKLKLKPFAESITYHDPCQVSRRGGATQAPRDILAGFAQDFREMAPTGNANWCCGGGGGVAAIESATDLRLKVFGIKMDQVAETGADTMVSACANCRQSLDAGKEHFGWDKDIASLVEIVADHLDE